MVLEFGWKAIRKKSVKKRKNQKILGQQISDKFEINKKSPSCFALSEEFILFLHSFGNLNCYLVWWSLIAQWNYFQGQNCCIFSASSLSDAGQHHNDSSRMVCIQHDLFSSPLNHVTWHCWTFNKNYKSVI